MSIAGPIVAFEAPALARPTFSFLKLLHSFAVGISDAVSDANEKRAAREIENFVARNRGMFTDEVERQLGQCLSRS